ncbi:MAG: RibD family protein [Pseudomonadota bacterium]
MTTLPSNIPFTISNSDPTAAIKTSGKLVIGQLGQTLDGCIATPTGDSKYINSDCGLRHLHAVRSAVDGVLVGVGSVNADNPKLTVRLCDGDHPARIIIDPRGRVDMQSDIFRDGSAEVIVITCKDSQHPARRVARVLELPHQDFHIDPASIIEALQVEGLERLLIEGGNRTLSNFLDAGVIDRLHLIVAPVIMGGGLSGLQLAPIDKLHEALRPTVTLYPLGQDVLFDCNFRSTAN